MVAGFLIMTAAASPLIVQAAEINQSPASQCQQTKSNPGTLQIKPDKAAQRLSEIFNIDKATILQYHTNGMSFKDIREAAFLANASGTSLDNVISHKTSTNKWKDVVKAMGITRQQMQAEHQKLVANHRTN